MSSKTIPAEVVYTWKSFKLIKMVEYGVSVDVLRPDSAAPPPEGARFDAHFEADLEGPNLKGTMICADYIHVRPDRRIQLHMHGEITTDDGAKIAMFADGISSHRGGTNWYHNENVTLITSFPKYSWVNKLQIWANGYIDPGEGVVDVTGYVA